MNWDLSKMFKNEESYKDTINEINTLLKEVISYKGHILESANNLYEFLVKESKLNELLSKCYVYSYLDYYSDMASNTKQESKEEINLLSEKVYSSLSFINPELLESDFDLIEKYIKENKLLEEYKFSLEKIYRYKSHTLSVSEEKILSDVSSSLDSVEEAYSNLDNVDIKLGNIIDENGNTIELNSSNYSKYITSESREVRKDAYEKMLSFYKNHINTISALYIGNIKSDTFISNTKKYNSTLEMELYSDNLPVSVYEMLIKIVDNNINLLSKYYDIKKESLGLKDMYMYDTYANISKMPNKEVSYEDGIKIILDSLKPLNGDYINNIKYLFDSNCVDVYRRENKRSGAYEWGSYGTDPYVSTNYENNIDSVSTVIHEMGHAMHTYYSNKCNSYEYSNYPIFLAEIASTVNEILLSEYLINNSKSDEEKLYFIVDFLDKFKSTVYRQTMFAEFEYLMHNKYENGISLTKDVICNTYNDLVCKHFPNIKNDEIIKYEWARIPHFYNSFYVYKYATGFISALVIVNKLLNDKEYYKKYIDNFLSAGCSKYPLDILKSIDVDITDENVLNDAFKVFEEKLEMLEKIIESRSI